MLHTIELDQRGHLGMAPVLDQIVKRWVYQKLLKSIWNHKNIWFNQRSTYTIHAVIPMECDDYPSILICKHANVFSGEIKLHYVHLSNMTPYKTCTVLKYKYAQFPYWKLFANEMFQILLSNNQGHRVHDTIIFLFRSLICW